MTTLGSAMGDRCGAGVGDASGDEGTEGDGDGLGPMTLGRIPIAAAPNVTTPLMMVSFTALLLRLLRGGGGVVEPAPITLSVFRRD
jgi:hypothetical protein